MVSKTGAFRLLAMSAYLCLVLPVMWALAVLRLIHTPLRSLGLPNRWLPLDVVSCLFSRGVLFFSGVEVDVLGTGPVSSLPVTIFMPNHSSGLDPFLLTGTAPMNPVFVFKRELMFYFPPVFLMGYIYGHIPIVRSKRESAINSLSKAAKKISKYHRSVCIFPEGTRSLDGKVMALKSGPFYMSEEAKVAVTPVYLVGAHHLMNKGQILPSQGGVVVVEYQQPIPYKGQTHEQMKEQVEKALKDAEKKWEGKKMRRGGYSVAWCVLPIAILTWILLKLFYL